MRAKHGFSALLAVLLVPLLLANKDCNRSTMWGEKYFTEWEEDHVDIDEETRCVDCHDDITTPKVKPKNHDALWQKKHGNFAQQKLGFRTENVCYLCHDESTCTDCHQQEEPQQHTEFWKQRGHGAAVGLNRSSCTTCHKSADFCERCHSTVVPTTHNAAWGTTTNRHCLNCHFPLTSAGGQQCGACHTGTPSHSITPDMPSDTLHGVAGAECRTCHVTLTHLDNGTGCTSCHTR